MKQTYPSLPALPVAAAAGLAGTVLRLLLYRTGFDEKGILSSGHPLHLSCLALAAGMLVYFAFRVRKTENTVTGRPVPRLLLGLAAGCLMLIQGLSLYRGISPDLWLAAPMSLYRRISGALPLVRCALMVLAGIAMGICTLPGNRSRTLATVCHSIVCIAFAADMLGRYQVWSGNPQLPDYVFHVLAGVALSLGSYQTLALYTGLGKPGLQRFFCLSGLFLCLLCLVGPDPWNFYLSGALWSAACLLTTVPPQEDIREENTDVPA